MLLYSLLYLLGYDDIGIDEIKRFRQLGSRTAGHPEWGHASGIETTTGPLGQGIGNAVGMALAERILNARFGDDIVDHRTYVLCGDGDLMEGISQEAIALAGHLNLGKLIVLLDDNGITIDGSIQLSDSTDQIARFEACGWHAIRCDGHDHDEIAAAIEAARQDDRPSLIAAKTTIGYGAPNKGGTNKAHGAPLGADEVAAARQSLGWTHEAFDVPSEILDQWRIAGLRSSARRREWEARFAAVDAETRGEFERRLRGDLPSGFVEAVQRAKRQLNENRPKVATRKASEMALEVINAVVSETIGGSADLTGSNNTRTSQTEAVAPGNYSGRFVHYGIREHGMAAAMNGLALHGGLIPYSGTFLTFSDYCRPAMRLSALMGLRVVYVMTHDSIGLGEDGPTHQPVEQLAALRAIPNLKVFRPADAVETLECWQLALESRDAPSVLALSRQNLPAMRIDEHDKNRCARGAYELEPAYGRGCRHDLRDRLGSGDRGRGAAAAGIRGRADARRLGALLRASGGPERRIPPRHAGRRQPEGRDRGRHPAGLGRPDRPRRCVHRHDLLRRLRPRRRTLPAFRDHRRGRRRSRARPARRGDRGRGGLTLQHRPENRNRFSESTMRRFYRLERPLCVQSDARRSRRL